MKKEIEILVRLNSPVDKVLADFEYKFKKTKIKNIKDIYYGDLNERSLRLRLNEDKPAVLCYKKDYYEKGKWIYSDEYETEVSSFKTTEKILNSLGYFELVKVEMVKHCFINKKYEIVIEKVKSLGNFLEVEAIAENEEVDKTKKEIALFISSLNLDVSEELNEGKAEMMLKIKDKKTTP